MTMHLGYSNYLTAMVALWCDNNRNHHDAVRGQVEYFRVISTHSGKEYGEARFSEWLERYVRRSMTATFEATGNDDSVASTILEYGMGLVDWLQLARKYLKGES